jgi:methionyl-tRNA formyltransferase
MKKEELRIVYMGTPDFAVGPLKSIIKSGYNVVGVITVADKPAGRGRKLRQSPVKEFADSMGIKTLQPIKLKDPEFINELRALEADIQIVVAFRMLPEVVWKMPPMGTFNLHASLLPNYRGAAPINWAIINGEEFTGVSTFFLKHEIDTGNILMQRKVNIDTNDSAGSLHDKLMHVGSELVVDTLDHILKGDVKAIEQDKSPYFDQSIKEAPKLFKEDCRIDFSTGTQSAYNFIRGLSPYPAAFTEITLANGDSKLLKIFSTVKSDKKGKIGSHQVMDGELYFFTKDGALKINELQLEGKKRMLASDFLRGTALAD